MFGSIENQDKLIQHRREWVFLLLAGVFLGSLAMLNILGISRFIDLSSFIGIGDESDIRFIVAVGVLPYPITFLCTDIISELYGRRRANLVVWIGLLLNIWILIVLWLGGALFPPEELLTNGSLSLTVNDGHVEIPHGYAFYEIRRFTFGATFASMIAYLTAQFIDVSIYHRLKAKTKGKYLWLRNNVSTMTSQIVDSVAVILITHYFAGGLPINEGDNVSYAIIMFILSSYLFKFVFALLDTIPFYWIIKRLRVYLKIDDELSL